MRNEKNIYRETWQGSTPGYSDGNPTLFPASQLCEKMKNADHIENAVVECEQRYIAANDEFQKARQKKIKEKILGDIESIKQKQGIPEHRREKMLKYLNQELNRVRYFKFNEGAEQAITASVGEDYGISPQFLEKIWQPKYLQQNKQL